MMILTRKNESTTAMDLVQITDKNGRHPARRVLFELLLAIALSVGCWYTFFSMFPNPVDPIISILLIAGLPVGLYLLCWNPFLGRFLTLWVFAAAGVFCAAAYKQVWNGLLVLANTIIEVLNAQMKAGLVSFEAAGDSVDWSTDVFLVMIPIILLVSMAIVHSIYHKEPLLGFAFTAFPVMVGLCLKIDPSIWLLILLLLCWTGLLVLSAVARPVSRKKNRPIYIQNPRNSLLPYLFLGITLVLLLGYVLLFSGDDYRPPQTVNEARDVVVAAQEHLRYSKLGGDEIDQLSGGDLNQVHPLAYTGNPALTLTMENPQAMYLRGFVGGEFKNDQWEEALQGAYGGQYTGLLERLAKEEFYPWMQQERLYSMLQNAAAPSNVYVNNRNGSSRYLYLPYEAALSGDALPEKVNYKKDYGAFTKGLTGQRQYTFQTYPVIMKDYNEKGAAQWIGQLKASSGWADYSKAEAAYRDYVYDTYLSVSNKDAAALGASGIERCEGKSIAYTLDYIRKNFEEEFTYNPQQEKALKGKGQLDAFMNDSYSGNDMHFATAAALMFRKAGIPARYAEGYYLSPEYISAYLGMDHAEVDVPDSLAHSWVEIYVDEIGWFPVEVVPGYYGTGKTQNPQPEEPEKLKEADDETYENVIPEDSREPEEKQETEKQAVSWLWFVLAAIALLILIYEAVGRRRSHKRLASFAAIHTDEQVYKMYAYAGRVMAFDGHPLPDNPYDQLEELSAAYDAVTHITFAEFLRLVNRVRFGEGHLLEEEYEAMNRYVRNLAKHVYQTSKGGKKFLMKWVRFYI